MSGPPEAAPVTAEQFGLELRRLRMGQGTSQAALARAVHYSKAYLCKVERGQKPPTQDLARRCDDALGTGGVLSRLAAARPGRARGPRPAQLPLSVPDFTGREAELAWLADACAREHGRSLTVAITGSPGVGKTALAVRWAHQLAARHPDGQLYLNLRGNSQSAPLGPADALGRLLRGLGDDPAEIPADADEAAARLRSLLAGRRTVIMLDNAASSDQVRPLLPGSAGSVVVITSRDRLTGLAASHGVARLPLPTLRGDEATALLLRLLGPARVTAERDAAGQLAAACAGLPLALRIAAAKLADHPELTIAEHAAQVRTGARLESLQVVGDEQEGVRAAFALSYQRLAAPTRRVFRALGVMPGDTISAAAAAALAGWADPAAACDELSRLEAASLVEEVAPGRFGAHDLLRSYARELARAEDGPAEAKDSETAASLRRLLEHYVSAADTARTLLTPHTLRLPGAAAYAGPGRRVRFADTEQAVGWLDDERANLAAVAQAAAASGDRAAVYLADALRGYFWLRRGGADWITIARAGLAVARARHEDAETATALWSLADGQLSLGRYDAARAAYAEASALAAAARRADLQAAIVGTLGMLYREQGDLAAAVTCYEQGLALCDQSGQQTSLSAMLGNLGIAYMELGRLDVAASHQERALAMQAESGDQLRLGRTMDNLAAPYFELGRWPEAEDLLLRAVPVQRAAGDAVGAAHTRNSLASLYSESGRYDEAHVEADAALAAGRRTGDRTVEADALSCLAAICVRQARWHEGLALYRQAAALAADIGRFPEATARLGLSAALLGLGRRTEAAQSAAHALTLARAGSFRLIEGRALVAQARVLLAENEPAAAAELAREAVTVQARAGHRLGEARAQRALGEGLLRAGRAAEGLRARERALVICLETGSPDALELRAEMRAGRAEGFLAGARHQDSPVPPLPAQSPETPDLPEPAASPGPREPPGALLETADLAQEQATPASA